MHCWWQLCFSLVDPSFSIPRLLSHSRYLSGTTVTHAIPSQLCFLTSSSTHSSWYKQLLFDRFYRYAAHIIWNFPSNVDFVHAHALVYLSSFSLAVIEHFCRYMSLSFSLKGVHCGKSWLAGNFQGWHSLSAVIRHYKYAHYFRSVLVLSCHYSFAKKRMKWSGLETLLFIFDWTLIASQNTKWIHWLALDQETYMRLLNSTIYIMLSSNVLSKVVMCCSSRLCFSFSSVPLITLEPMWTTWGS